MMARLRLSEVIEVRRHAHKIGIFILTSEMADPIWCLCSIQSLSVGLSMDVTQFALLGAHYHAGVIYLLL